MSRIDAILSRLSKVKGRHGSYTACCPAHDDRSPSLAVRETDDGRILLHCFGGCSVQSVLDAIGMDMTDLFPERQRDDYTQKRGPERVKFYASDLLRVIAFEATVVMIAARDLSRGRKLSESDMQRLESAWQRIDAAMGASNGNT
jgi:hypothetical protein